MRNANHRAVNFASRLHKMLAGCLTLAILSLTLWLPASAHAAQGDLVTSFGTGGRVTTDIAGFDSAMDAIKMPDGRIIVSGFSQPGPSSPRGMTLAAYLPNGALDANFGQGGTIHEPAGLSSSHAAALAVQNGKLLVASLEFPSVGSVGPVLAIKRYTSNGVLDATFGNNGGFWLTLFFASTASIQGMVVQADGKIVISYITNQFIQQFQALRLLADGSAPDASFGQGGLGIVSFAPAIATPAALALQGDRILLAGTMQGEFTVACLTAAGVLDTTFGSGGIAKFAYPQTGQLQTLAVQPDNKLLLGGYTSVDAYTVAALVRLQANGAPDPTFGNGGAVTTDFFSHEASFYSLVTQADGKIVAAGVAGPAINQSYFALARFNANGSADLSFSADGKTTETFSNALSFCGSLILKNDGNVVAIGTTTLTNPNGRDFALASFETAGPSYDIVVKDDLSNSYLKLNSVTGAYRFTDCAKNLSAEGTAALSTKGCKLTVSGGGLTSSLAALVNSCTKQGEVTVVIVMPGQPSSKTYQFKDANITNNPAGCF